MRKKNGDLRGRYLWGQLPALGSVGTSELASINLEPYHVPSANDMAPQTSLHLPAPPPPECFQMAWPKSPTSSEN